MSPNTSVRPPSITLPGTRHESPIERGVLVGRASTTPLSKTMMQCGACVYFASIPPSIGRPVPMNAISPSRTSRAAQIAMSSVRLYPGSDAREASVAIVHPSAEELLRPKGREAILPELPHVGFVILDAVDPLGHPGLPSFEGDAPLRVLLSERGVRVVVALDLVRMGAPRLGDDLVDPEARDDRAVRVPPHDAGRDDLLDAHEDPLPRERAPEVVPELPPDLRVPFLVAALCMEERHVGRARRKEGDLRAAAEGILEDDRLRVAERLDPQEVGPEVGADRHEGEAHRGRHEAHRHPEVRVLLDQDRPRDALFHRAAVALGEAEGLEPEVGALELLDAACPDHEVGILRPAAQEEREVAPPLADHLVDEGHGALQADSTSAEAYAVRDEFADRLREGHELVVDLEFRHGSTDGANPDLTSAVEG